MKRISLLLIVFILSVFIVTGCEKDNENIIISNNEKVDVSKMEHKHCTRAANAGSNIEVNLDYDVYYKGEDILLLKSVEQVVTNDRDSLDSYEDAYNSIKAHYSGLEYYDQDVERTSSSVTNTIVINYEKINVKALLDIEGEEDNIIENGKAKLDKWMELGKKFGIICGKSSSEIIDSDEEEETTDEEETTESM